MKANFKQNFIRISRGYVWVPNNSKDTLRHYAEVWVSTSCMEYQLRIFPAKGMSVSWYADASWKSWRYEYSYLYKWFNVTDVARRSIFERCDINFFVGGIIQQTGLRIWEESRKWLTPAEKECAHMLAVNSIGILDAEELLATDVCDMPQAFHEEVSRFRNEYNAYLNRQEQEDREMAKRLNTREGLSYLLGLAKRHGEHIQAVTFINQVVYDLTELWDK